jgi:hypothetical protein
MRITKEWLNKWSACPGGKEWFFAQKECNGAKVVKKLINENYFDWANWTIARILNKKQRIQYSIFAAEQVIEIFEEEYPKDKRPREAIEAAKKYLKSPTKENKDVAADAAYTAANAADSAAYAAARAAANAAHTAAYTADSAYAAAYTADSAANAAYAAAKAAAYTADSAYAAAYAAADAEMKKKIIEYGLTLLGGMYER